MPPSSPQDSDNNLVDKSEPYYTNEDVAILHDIVVHAQELLPSLPERERVPTNALFHAYYAILPNIGIDTDHDSRYARVLFKIGGTRSNSSLYEKFEAVLSRMGIEIQFDQENNHEDQEGTKELHMDQTSDPPPYFASTPAVAPQERGRRRRNSESSAWDIEPGLRGKHERRPRSHSSISQPHSDLIARRLDTSPALLQTARRTTDQTPYNARPHTEVREHEASYGLKTWLSTHLDSYAQITRTRSASANGSLPVRERSPAAAKHGTAIASMFYPAGDCYATPGSLPQLAKPDQQTGLDFEHLHRLTTFPPASESLMNIKVNLMEQYRVKNFAHQICRHWRQKALQLQEDNNNLELLARHRDKQVLLRQAFDSWHANTVERQQKAETGRFFAHLGRRASRARDLFLLTKAFTHWAYIASDEIQRTSVARRHILRTRYFKAWRDITAVNELKVRRQVIRRFFSLWRKRHVSTITNMERAATIFTHNLVQRIFWTWFWVFCERRAPLWWADRMKGRTLAIWIRAASKNKNDENVAIEYHHRTTRQKISLAWIMKTRECVWEVQQSNEYRTSSLCRNAFLQWHRGSVLLPSLHAVREKIELRLKRNSLKLWFLRARQERQAVEIDRLKMMREAWGTWNDKLRCQSLQSRIGERLVLQGLYKWVLTERLVLARRLLDRRLMQSSLQKMVERSIVSIRKQWRDLRSARELADQKLKSYVIRCWWTHLQTQLQRQRRASDFSTPIALSDSLAKWWQKTRGTQQLQTWARDGEFYFLASKTLKSWKDATENAKREKRRNGYAQFRRMYKMRLAARLLSLWREQANTKLEMNRLAAETYHNKNVIFGMDIFDCWRGRTEEIAELESIRDLSLLRKRFNEMKIDLVKRRRLDVEAVSFFGERATAACIKKWSRVRLQLRAWQHLVSELREKYAKKTSRKIIGHWRQRTSQKRRATHSDIKEPNTEGGREKSTFIFTEREEAWSEFGDHPDMDEWARGLEEAVVSTPTPGYLSTPSKRTSRARTITKFSSTTPSAPLSTPVERQLRAHYSGGSLPLFRRALGKNLLSRKRTSENVEEEWSNTGESSLVS